MSYNFRDQIQSKEFPEGNNKEHHRFLKKELDDKAEKWNDWLMHLQDILFLEE